MEPSINYNPQIVEEKWYKYWEDNNYFASKPDSREPFTIVIPPPNITGVLHMGHMLNNTIQDILIRRARLQGKNACWVPGTDHASIATEAKVVRMLREKGIRKSDISREEFLKYAFDWKDKYGGIILQQLRKLGASCDWSRTAFTMDDIRSEAVITAFIDLYRKGKLYRGKRMIHWDPEAKTVLSNEEVIYKEEQAQLFHLKYEIESKPNEYVIIATQRPETIMADAAIAVHPDDERYTSLIGCKVKIPLIQKCIPIIADSYVDREFGTGALKITPAHDQNDYEIGQRHGLEIVDILNEDGSLNDQAQILIGMDRFAARKKIKTLLEEANAIQSIQDYKTNIGRSERTNAVVEPRLSLQWYVDSKRLAEPALKAVMNSDIEFLPENMKNTYKYWMENIRDWCISRQLWWGHRIPAYYYNDHVFVEKSRDEAVVAAKKIIGEENFIDQLLKQDEDVLDTWFSSWLWPISVFDGFKDSKDFKYYFPTSVLVTGWDIIFLWVARMIMASYEWKNEKPFQKVYFTGMVRDKQRRKMSKSLGNSPDALELMEKFGADGVRFGMLSSSPAGGDLLFDEKLCDQGRSFCNKIWHASRLVQSWKEDKKIASTSDVLVINWMGNALDRLQIDIDRLIDQSKLSEAIKMIYSFFYEDFSGFYLEAIKPKETLLLPEEVLHKTIEFFERICSILHPFMPFITEEVWHSIRIRIKGGDCMITPYHQTNKVDETILQNFIELRQVITNVLNLRNRHGIKMSEELSLCIQKSDLPNLLSIAGTKELLMKFARLTDVAEIVEEDSEAQSFLGLRNKYFLKMPIKVNVEEELVKIKEEIEYTNGFIKSCEAKLANERFISGAPKELIDKEIKKLQDGKARLQSLEYRYNSLIVVN